jgi:probable rRNA maturation factor
MHALELTITAMTGQRHAEFLHTHLIQAHKMIRSPLRELSLALVGDRPMSNMHKRFMGIDGPTDVLTFPLEFDARRRPAAAEVVVCVPQARRQATERGTRIESELLLYAIHGLLHLSGFDDRTPRDYQRMHRMEDTILGQLGVGSVFAPKSAPRRGGGRRS